MAGDRDDGPSTERSPAAGQGEAIRLFQLLALDGSGEVWRATRGHVSVGSHPINDVILHAPTVSRFHCELKAGDDGVWVTDLGSLNGTSVDGVRLKAGLLVHGNVLRAGGVALRFERLAEREALQVSSATRFGALTGSSQVMRAIFATLERAAQSDTTLLLEGETGTGKGAIAEAVHSASGRRDRPFVVVDCGAMTASLLESELFGHERGAFTGADQRRIGAFEEAGGGTIFLDEIGELPPDLQPRLLRVLENRTVRRLGQNQHQSVDVRIIAATNRDLRLLVNEGKFRADLYYRLAVVCVRIPALRERISDLGELVAALLGGLGASAEQIAAMTLPAQIDVLARSTWPGNVRELRNHLERALVLPPGAAEIDRRTTIPLPEARRRAVDAFERRYLEEVIQLHGGRVAEAARSAGVARIYLYRLLAKHGLKPGTTAGG